MRPELYIGTRTVRGSLERYAEHFNLMEVRPSNGSFPKKRTLLRWRESVPEDFKFVVVLPALEAKAASIIEEHSKLVRSVVENLRASVLLLPTTSTFRPTTANKDRLRGLVQSLGAICPIVAWEPSGMWDRQEAAELAREAGWLYVDDPAREALADGPSVYGRIRGLGENARLSPTRLQMVIENLRTRQSACVIVESDLPGRVARDLRESLGMELDDYDGESDDEFDVIEPDSLNDEDTGESEA